MKNVIEVVIEIDLKIDARFDISWFNIIKTIENIIDAFKNFFESDEIVVL